MLRARQRMQGGVGRAHHAPARTQRARTIFACEAIAVKARARTCAVMVLRM